MATPSELLDIAYQKAIEHYSSPIISDSEIANRVRLVSHNETNRAGARLLLACSLAKIHRPDIDIRKPYTEIGTSDSYSGRTYDEAYVSQFITKHDLPCNPTSAFLTPGFRTGNVVLTPGLNLSGRPPAMYNAVLQLLTDVYEGKVSAQALLAETVRQLLILKEENRRRLELLLKGLKPTENPEALSAEAIVRLIEHHLEQPRASRLPVLVVAAAYKAVSPHLEERALPLASHNAADSQTGALGDVEITLANEDKVIASYEMKTRRVTIQDIQYALRKIHDSGIRVDHYVFITTDQIEEGVTEYARGIYEQSGGIEFVVLDCIGFLRHYLHLFHRQRMQFLETYQELVLVEPDSAVNQALKEAFLVLRRAAQSS